MEEVKKNPNHEGGTEKDIVFSKTIKAGKRIYYLDVKKNRKDEMYLAITESKKVIIGEGENPQVNFEKHKIFLYREDFERFAEGLNEVIRYIVQAQGPCPARNRHEEASSDVNAGEGENPIKLEIEF